MLGVSHVIDSRKHETTITDEFASHWIPRISDLALNYFRSKNNNETNQKRVT